MGTKRPHPFNEKEREKEGPHRGRGGSRKASVSIKETGGTEHLGRRLNKISAIRRTKISRGSLSENEQMVEPNPFGENEMDRPQSRRILKAGG